MRLSVVAACLSLCLIGFSIANDAHASIRKVTNIPAEGLGPALNALAKDRNFQIVYVTEEIANVRTQGAVGEFTTEEALKQLLTGTGLTYRYLDDKTITIGSATTPQSGISRNSQPTSSGSSDDANTVQEGKKNSSAAFRLAQVDQRANSQSSTVENNASTSPDSLRKGQLTEIVVTAEKRSERLQDVPVPVTAISADALVNSNQLRLQDYYTSIPGLSVAPAVQSAQIVSIRGVTTGTGTNPTVGITIDDVPYGSSTGLGGGTVVPDLDPGDLTHVEVLRGPQGTLYGANSMGGLIKFVTVDPSTDAVSGRAQAGLSGIKNGAELGYNVRASVNVPLSDTLAIRASAFTRQDPGYIDNPVLHINGINEQRVSGGRLSALWRPSDAFSLKLGALFQDTKGDGSNDVEIANAAFPQTVGLKDLQQNNLRGTGWYDRKVQAYSAILDAKFGDVDFIAISGFSVNSFSDSNDFTYALGDITQNGLAGTGFNGFGVPGTVIEDQNKTNKFTQEVRLSAPIAAKIEWVLGAFYTHENSQYTQPIRAENPATGLQVGETDYTRFPTTYTEYAAFTDLTFRITDRFDVQVGGRESHIRQSITETEVGPFVPVFDGVPSPWINPEVDTTSNAFTYLVTPRFKISSDLMVYARLASGYRAGGPNAAPGVPRQYDPDKTQNYDIGIKGDFLDRTLSIDASLYYIDWKDIQLSLLDPVTFFSYTANASRARSRGAEISTESKPLQGLTVSAWVAFNDAKLTEGFPITAAYGVSGDRLPFSSRFSGNLSLQQDFSLTSSVTAFVGGSVSYVGDRLGAFTSSSSRQVYPAYAKTDLRAGAKYDSWTLNFFVSNAFDRRGVLQGGLGNFPPFAFNYILPRTVGLSLSRTF